MIVEKIVLEIEPKNIQKPLGTGVINRHRGTVGAGSHRLGTGEVSSLLHMMDHEGSHLRSMDGVSILRHSRGMVNYHRDVVIIIKLTTSNLVGHINVIIVVYVLISVSVEHHHVYVIVVCNNLDDAPEQQG